MVRSIAVACFYILSLASSGYSAPSVAGEAACGNHLLQYDTLLHSQHGSTSGVQYSSKCGPSPQLDGQQLAALIGSTKGVLLVAIKDMFCTRAIEQALQQKGITATVKYFTSNTAQPGSPLPSDSSDVWQWLHCTYPDDGNMHSYVFVDGSFVGNGFQAADKVKNGQYDSLSASAGAGLSCIEKYPQESRVIQKYKDQSENRVLLFGWQGCPCTGIAQSRLAASSVCYDGRTWANPSSSLMLYLQCETGDTTHHSFAYFRDGDDWKFVGTGFDLAESALSQGALDDLVAKANARTDCQKASVLLNIYGKDLEECRLPSDEEGGSWMDDGKCTETTGGIHQICIQAGTLPHDFSMSTYQSSDWSESRTHSSHCICVGAWSTYMTEEQKHPEGSQKITPRCKSIPETVLSKEYMGNWKDWNGFVANVGMGLGELVERCLAIDDVVSKCGLKERFMRLNSEEDAIKNAPELDKVRANLESIQCHHHD